MWIIQEPKKVALWNKRRFEEKKRRVCSIFKILSTYICWRKYIKCNIWRVVVHPSYIEDARFLKANCDTWSSSGSIVTRLRTEKCEGTWQAPRPTLGKQTPFYLMSFWYFITGVRRSERKADHSSPPMAEIKKGWRYELIYEFVE